MRACRLGLVALLWLVVTSGAARFAMAGEGTIVDPGGDAGDLPDCEPEGAFGAPSWVDLVAVDIRDEDGVRVVEVRASGDLGQATAEGPDARVEVWVGRGGAVVVRFVHGIAGGAPADAVQDGAGNPLGIDPVDAAAAPDGTVVFRIPLELLHALELLFGDAALGAVAVSTGHCDKLAIQLVGGVAMLLGAFPGVPAGTTTTDLTTTTQGPPPGSGTSDGSTTTTSTQPAADRGSRPGWLVALWAGAAGLAILLVLLTPWWRRYRRVRARCAELEAECERLRREAEQADRAARQAAAAEEAAVRELAQAAERLEQANAEAAAKAEAAANAAAEGTDESNWVEGDEGRITQGEVDLLEDESRETTRDYQRGELDAEEMARVMGRSREERLAAARARRDARAREAADRLAEAQRWVEASLEAHARAQEQLESAEEARAAAEKARDAAAAAAAAACEAADKCRREALDSLRSETPPEETADIGA